MLAAALIVLPRQILALLSLSSFGLPAPTSLSLLLRQTYFIHSCSCSHQGVIKANILSPLLTLWVFPPTRLTHCYIFVVLWIFCCEVASWLPGSNRFWVVFQAGVLSPFQVTSSTTNLLPLSGLWRDKERI